MTRREYRKKKAGKEKKWFQKKTALKVFGGFFALMAACTVLSRVAASVLVAQVEVENPTGGTVTSTFEGQGEVVPSDEKQVFLWAEQQVEKSAAQGTAVKKGGCLVQFRMEYLEKCIDEKRSEIDQLKLQLEQQEIAARGAVMFLRQTARQERWTLQKHGSMQRLRRQPGHRRHMMAMQGKVRRRDRR